uniref:ATP-binding protein n=1 Tax=Streptomyces sp. NBC_00003 TaxID=2903608 RepID=A0AAU2V4Z1_9ACTN
MGHHEAPEPTRALRHRTLLRAGLTVTAVGAALAGAGSTAQAAPVAPASTVGQNLMSPDLPAAARGVTGATGYAIAPAKTLRLDPLANTGVDPLNNGVGTQVADFKPVSTAMATSPVTSGGALNDLPLAGRAAGLLPG